MCILDLVIHSKIETFMIKEIEKKYIGKTKDEAAGIIIITIIISK